MAGDEREDTDRDVETVREALHHEHESTSNRPYCFTEHVFVDECTLEPALAALDRIGHRLTEAERERDELLIERDNAGFIPWAGAQDAIDELVYRAERAEAALREIATPYCAPPRPNTHRAGGYSQMVENNGLRTLVASLAVPSPLAPPQRSLSLRARNAESRRCARRAGSDPVGTPVGRGRPRAAFCLPR